jgi:hypothetical protein
VEAAVNLPKLAVRSALLTALFLFGGLILGFFAAMGFSGLPMHLPESASTFLAMVIIMTIVSIASAGWGRAMARACGVGEARRMAWAGVLSFGPALVLAGFALSALEVAIVERGNGPDLPVHVVFTILFVPAAFIVAGLGGLALGLAQRDIRLAIRMGLSSGLAGAAAFLLANLLMDRLGWRVGAPGAAERATMLTVMMTGNLGAALAGGAAIGVALGRKAVRSVTAEVRSAISIAGVELDG